MSNPGQKFFCWGISAKRLNGPPWFDKTYYGAGTPPKYFCLGGKGGNTGYNGEKLRKGVKMNHFSKKRCQVDIYLDLDQGIFKLCVVGISGENKEVYIDGLCNSKNTDGWVPHLFFANISGGHLQQIRACKIDSECYGQKMDIQWK